MMTNEWFEQNKNSLQVGLNETPLTKALVAGQFGLAEKLILENTDVDYLNDGKAIHVDLYIVKKNNFCSYCPGADPTKLSFFQFSDFRC